MRVLRLLVVIAGTLAFCSLETSDRTCSTRRTFSTLVVALCAQPPARIATTAEALVAAPVFFHGKQIVVRRGTIESDGLVRLAGTAKPIFVIWKDHTGGSIDSEIRGEFWDVGRIQRDDPRFSSLDFKPLLDSAWHGEWPPRDHVFVILNAGAVESPLPADATVRAIALAPEHYKDRTVTLVGRFRGTNLYGDLPLPVAKSRWDFVIQSADAAVWITGLRPRGKGFDLDPTARMDTGRWLQIAGTLRVEGPLPWVEATAITIASAPDETPVDVTLPTSPREVAPQVVFTAPIAGETDADRGGVRIQFSRDMDPKSFRDHIHVSYVGQAPQGAPAAPPAFTFKYDEGTRALEMKFASPLDRFRQVRVDLTDGIVSAVDNQPFAPWALTFTTGG